MPIHSAWHWSSGETDMPTYRNKLHFLHYTFSAVTEVNKGKNFDVKYYPELTINHVLYQTVHKNITSVVTLLEATGAKKMSTVPNRVNVKLARLFYKYMEESKERQNERTEKQIEKPTEKKDYESYPPYNFSWFIENKIAAMGWPQTEENLNYLVDVGVNHLITLSPERWPPIAEFKRKLKWTEIRVKEFGAPTLKQILKFIEICERAHLRGEVVGVHCRHGRGRTGTMLACYLVHFQEMAPERAVLTVRVQRPGSCETYEQEKVVCHYHDCLRGTIPKPDYRLVEDKLYFDMSMKYTYAEDKSEDSDEETEEKVVELGQADKRVKLKLPKKKSNAMVINHKIYF